MSTAACAGRLRPAAPGLALALVATLNGCGGGGYWGDSGTDWRPSTGAATGGTTPPETEGDFLAMPPAQTDQYVFIANPTRNTLSRVTVADLAVITTPVGPDPRLVVTTPDHARVIALNRGDDTVSILDAHTLDQQVVAVRDDLNRLELSPDGRWAVLWHDRNAVLPGDPAPDGLQSFSEASFVEVATGAHSGMAVGYDPHDVVFTPDGDLAVVVTDAHLTLVDLTQTPLTPAIVPLSAALEPPEAEEVVLAPDGRHAFVRQFGATEVLVVDLLARTVASIPVGTNPTDLDLSPDGATAVAITRGSEQLWVIDAVDPANPPTALTLPAGQGYGSIAFDPNGGRAVLYTTALPVDRYALWTQATGEIVEHGLRKPISSVAVDPTGEHVLFFHPDHDAPGADPGDPFTGQFAVSIVALDDDYQNPLLLPAAPLGYVFTDDGRYAYFAMEGQKFLEVLDLPAHLHDQVPLDSVPVYLGAMPVPTGAVAWVSQDHELGRISFWDQVAHELDTITGFELNSGIERE